MQARFCVSPLAPSGCDRVTRRRRLDGTSKKERNMYIRGFGGGLLTLIVVIVVLVVLL